MITSTTLSLDDKIKKASKEKAKEKQIRGGLSGLVELLLKEYLIKEKVKISE